MKSGNNQIPINMRIANFSNLELSTRNILNFDGQPISLIVDELRNYSDLPLGFLFTPDQTQLVTELLSELKVNRFACFPYTLFQIGGSKSKPDGLDLTEIDIDFIRIDLSDADNIENEIISYARRRFAVDHSKLKIGCKNNLPKTVDVVIVGAGVTGLYAANRLLESDISFSVLDQREIIGGIWSLYANSTSQVNTSEAAYRLIEKKFRLNKDHSTTREILEDIAQLGRKVSDGIYLNTKVDRIEKSDGSYRINVTNNQESTTIQSKGIILAINDRVGEPRKMDWKNQDEYRGELYSGISDAAKNIVWKNKRVAIIGMGAFAVENARTALEGGARHVTVVCRRHGTVCPKIIDYLNFTTAYDQFFKHDKKSNMRNMLLWKKLYDLSGATHPECWMGKIKHDGHTISVSDIWFIGHFLRKITTVTGNVSGMYENGVIIDSKHRVEADVVLNCVGFERNATSLNALCSCRNTYNINYLDRDMMYLADAYIDDDAFNSFFGSSVLEMVKFYMDVYVYFFNNPEFFRMIQADGIEILPIEDRSWSHYIAGASSLMKNYDHIYDLAKKQVSQRTQNFLEAHDLERYIRANKREWIDTHALLAGRKIKEGDCLPYIFQKLVEKTIP